MQITDSNTSQFIDDEYQFTEYVNNLNHKDVQSTN